MKFQESLRVMTTVQEQWVFFVSTELVQGQRRADWEPRVPKEELLRKAQQGRLNLS